ncbi:YtpR family tRNA-binding protein [Alkalicoccobacillus gibsonii]|uniref:YtpR family tRNA-binding protein n=1 Tax=Alkalicoccobacillus gibsonii TaxID=79881 RepID=A0ABU9VLD5_9BACI
MNVFYNLKGVGDTLLISLSNIEVAEQSYERTGNIARIFDTETNKTIGYNVFNASTFGVINDSGVVELTDSVKSLIQSAFSKEGMTLSFDGADQPTFVVGYVMSKEKHPNADKLGICQVDVGQETLQIVCGAPNVEAGQKVVVALVGAVMPSGLQIKQASLRGVESNGMICSAKELNLPNAPEEKGILVLDESYEAGQPFTR